MLSWMGAEVTFLTLSFATPSASRCSHAFALPSLPVVPCLGPVPPARTWAFPGFQRQRGLRPQGPGQDDVSLGVGPNGGDGKGGAGVKVGTLCPRPRGHCRRR